MMRAMFLHKRLLLVATWPLPLLVLLVGCGVSSGVNSPVVTQPAAISTGTATSTSMNMPSMSTPTEAGGQWVQQETTQDYKLTLRLGEVAQMLTPEQAKTATSGEVMVSGEMAMGASSGMMDGMSAGKTPNHHLELAVADIKSGTVITDKSVSIDLTNTTTSEKISVPIAVMYDVQEGIQDTHFGNNLALAPGNYRVVVDVGGEMATFNLAISEPAGATILQHALSDILRLSTPRV